MLLAWLDGEAGGRAASRIDEHLKLCWDCRSRCDELNRQAIALAALMRGTPFPGILEEVSAHEKMFERIWAFEAHRAEKLEVRRARVQSRWLIGGVAFAGACLVLLASFFQNHSKQQPDMGNLLVRSAQQERDEVVTSRVLHQVVNVQISEGASDKQIKSKKIEIWNDQQGARYSEKVASSNGFDFAVWHPSAEKNYALVSGGRVLPVRASTAADITLVSCIAPSSNASLAEAFESWIRNRAWRPITMAEDFASFVGPDKSTLQVRRQREGTTDYALFIARRQVQGRVIQMSLLVDIATLRPYRQEVTLLSGASRSEISLTLHAENLKPADVPMSDFAPDEHLLEPVPVEHLLEPVQADNAESNELIGERENVYPSEEVLTLKALEDLGVERENIIELSPSADGELLLRVMIPDVERRDELIGELSRGRPYLKIEARLPDPSSLVTGQVVTPPLTSAFISAWDKAYGQALDLIDLKNRFGSNKISTMTPEAKSALEEIYRRHLDLLDVNLQASSQEMRDILKSNPQFARVHAADSEAADSEFTIDRFFADMDRADDQLQLIQKSQHLEKGEAEDLTEFQLLLDRDISQMPELRSEVAKRIVQLPNPKVVAGNPY